MRKKTSFAISLFLTAGIALAVIHAQRPPTMVALGDGDTIYISSQVRPRDVRYLRQYGLRAIIDMRPDGEAADEPGHLQMAQAADAADMGFHYIPIPHETIPPTAVSALGDALASGQKPVVLYCRTGRRAVRTYALYEASRPGGPSVEAILAMVKNAGFSADDLRDDIIARIAERTPPAKGSQ